MSGFISGVSQPAFPWKDRPRWKNGYFNISNVGRWKKSFFFWLLDYLEVIQRLTLRAPPTSCSWRKRIPTQLPDGTPPTPGKALAQFREPWALGSGQDSRVNHALGAGGQEQTGALMRELRAPETRESVSVFGCCRRLSAKQTPRSGPGVCAGKRFRCHSQDQASVRRHCPPCLGAGTRSAWTSHTCSPWLCSTACGARLTPTPPAPFSQAGPAKALGGRRVGKHIAVW